MVRSILEVVSGIVALTISSFAIEWAADTLLMAFFSDAFPNRAALGRSVTANLFRFAYTTLCVAAGG